MQRFVLKSKIHRAKLTATELDYEGSIAIDKTLLEAAGILPGEQVHVLNLSSGARIVTYAIEAEAGSGTVMLNGPAARMGLKPFSRGDAGVVGGDVITAIDGEPIETPDDMLTALERRQPGDSCTLTLWRNGATRKQTVTLAESEE